MNYKMQNNVLWANYLMLKGSWTLSVFQSCSVGKWANIGVKEYLGFGDTADLSVIQYTEYEDGSKCIGELN